MLSIILIRSDWVAYSRG
jgi:acyl transferase domain-containing protein